MKIEIKDGVIIYDGEKYVKEEIEKKSEIDWSKMPVDTLVEVSDDKIDWYIRYFKEKDGGKIFCFPNGATSYTTADGNDTKWNYIRLIDNPWRPWFGGEMPCCGNVRVEVIYRKSPDMDYAWVHQANTCQWNWSESDVDIIAYRMLAE